MDVVMQRALLNFAEELIEAQDADAIQKAMAAIAESYGLKLFAYLAMPFEASGRAYLISNYPREWTDHYLDQHYERLDPVIARARQTSAPFLWGFQAGDLVRSRDHERFFDEAAGSGIRCGATLPVHDSAHRVAAVTFASDRKRNAFERTVEREQGVLQFIAASLHVHVRAKLLGDPLVNGIALTRREFDCLKWAARGKTAWEVGVILGIQEPTIRWHLANAKAKLGVDNIRQAVALYARQYLR
jgi:LuxR family transcriptional activator of conjugal transfer of Ti plasmids